MVTIFCSTMIVLVNWSWAWWYCSTQQGQGVWSRDQSPAAGGTPGQVQGPPPERADPAPEAGVPALTGHDEAEDAGKSGRKSQETDTGTLCEAHVVGGGGRVHYIRKLKTFSTFLCIKVHQFIY